MRWVGNREGEAAGEEKKRKLKKKQKRKRVGARARKDAKESLQDILLVSPLGLSLSL